MKNLYLFLFALLVSCTSPKDLSLKTVSVKEFKNFVNATGYVTSAEEYGWSFVQQNVYDYIVVDTAPVMEKPLAMQAGIGWQGKHTNIVSKKYGSWLFLSSIFLDLSSLKSLNKSKSLDGPI